MPKKLYNKSLLQALKNKSFIIYDGADGYGYMYGQITKNVTADSISEYRESWDIDESSTDTGESTLAAAIRLKFNYDLVYLVIDWGASLNSENHLHENIVHTLARHCFNESIIKYIVRLVVKKHPDLLTKHDVNGKTPLSAALQFSNSLVLKCLIEEGVLNHYNENKHKILHQIASMNNHQSKTELFRMVKRKHPVQYQAWLKEKDEHGNTPLAIAVQNGASALVEFLLHELSGALEQSELDELLQSAVDHGKIENIINLINTCADLKTVLILNGNLLHAIAKLPDHKLKDALFRLIQRNDTTLFITWLLETDNHLKLPIEQAAETGSIQSVSFLYEEMQGQVNPDVFTYSLFAAIAKKQTLVATFFIDKGAGLGATNDNNENILHAATRTQSFNLQKAIHQAVQQKSPDEAVRMSYQKNNQSKTPLTLAAESKQLQLTEFYLTKMRDGIDANQLKDIFIPILILAKNKQGQKQIESLKLISKTKRYNITFEKDKSLEQCKRILRLAVMNYFRNNVTEKTRRKKHGLGCASTTRRLQNGLELLQLLGQKFDDQKQLKHKVEEYTDNDIKTGFFARSLLKVNINEALNSLDSIEMQHMKVTS